MVEVTVQVTESDLKYFIRRDLRTIDKFDNFYEDTYLQYFYNIVDSGSATQHFGSTPLRTWLSEALDRLTIVTPSSGHYNEAKELWESKEYKNSHIAVVAKNETDYLVEVYYR